MKTFEELMTDNLQTTMRQIFGNSAYELIYTFMERQELLHPDETREKSGGVYRCLEKLLGSDLAHIVEGTCLRLLCLRLRREYKEVETYVALLGELYEIKLKLLDSKKEKSFGNLACN